MPSLLGVERDEADVLGERALDRGPEVLAALAAQAAHAEHARHAGGAERADEADLGEHERVHGELVDGRRAERDDARDELRPPRAPAPSRTRRRGSGR